MDCVRQQPPQGCLVEGRGRRGAPPHDHHEQNKNSHEDHDEKSGHHRWHRTPLVDPPEQAAGAVSGRVDWACDLDGTLQRGAPVRALM
ncbi:hypothetical protein GCM10009818_36460 [Nakamurella flavida]